MGDETGSSDAGASSDEDARLMLAVRDGDAGAFDRLYRRHGGPLLRHLERIVRRRAVAEELLQETFSRVHRARSRYQPEAKFSSWIYTIATHLALNELRRPANARPHRSLDDDGAAQSYLDLASDLPDPGAQIDAKRVGAAVDAALAELPKRQREALWRAVVDGQSYAQVAVELGTTEKSVKALVHRARVALADRLPVEGHPRDSGRARS